LCGLRVFRRVGRIAEQAERVADDPGQKRSARGRPEFTRRYAAVGLADIMAGIPVYAPEPGLHDLLALAITSASPLMSYSYVQRRTILSWHR
jgi:hypothetical protein